jgi:hypothetical protein
MKSLFPLACLMLVACDKMYPIWWTRTDGGPVLAQQHEVDKAICRQAQKSAPTAPRTGTAPGSGNDVYIGCMAQRGYVLKPFECPPTANGACAPFEPDEHIGSE